MTARAPPPLTANLPRGTATVTAMHVTVDAWDTTSTGNLHAAQNLEVDGMSSLNAGMAVLPGEGDGAAARIMGKLEAFEDVVSGPLSLRGHGHDKVKRDDDTRVFTSMNPTYENHHAYLSYHAPGSCDLGSCRCHRYLVAPTSFPPALPDRIKFSIHRLRPSDAGNFIL